MNGMGNYEYKHAANAEIGALPWWDYADEEEMRWQIARLKRGLRFCRGRAADLYPHIGKHIKFLERRRALLP